MLANHLPRLNPLLLRLCRWKDNFAVLPRLSEILAVRMVIIIAQ